MHTAAALPFVSSACALVLGIIILCRKPRSVAELALVLGLAALACEAAFAAITTRMDTVEGVHRWQMLRLSALGASVGAWLTFSLSYARGNYRAFVNRWRPAIAAAFLAPLAEIALFRQTLLGSVHLDASNGHWVTDLGSGGVPFHITLLIGAVAILMNLEKTFRAAIGTMRWKIKFMIMGVGLIWIVRIYTGSQAVVYRGLDANLSLINAGSLIVACALILVSIIRTGKSNVDVHPSQTMLQGSVAIVLVGVYLMLVGVFARFVTGSGGDAAFALKALFILVSMVAVAALMQSDRVRLWLRRFISRNFSRPLYDYRAAWGKFTESTVSQVEQAELCRSLVRLTADLFQALSVSIWVFDARGERLVLAASSSLTEEEGARLGPTREETAALRAPLLANVLPTEMQKPSAGWTAVLRRCQPSQFPEYSGPQVCVPLVGRGNLLGVLLVSDRVSNFTFTDQDFDMLKCVADHAAASILNAQLAQKLVEAKELEAFQSMAAFFVHDLKNAASTLNLTLKNLPEHYNDPEFREDALRGIGKSVTHINRLIGRLGTIRNELRVRKAPVDLNQVVSHAIAALDSATMGVVTKEFGKLPPIQVDDEQLEKVFTNLVLNAIEAMPRNGEGRIRISTAQNNGWAVVTVQDNGCGMSSEFMSRSLFRPFQTTKQTGLGIGMFQSKMIVEAHGGRIAAASEVGKGTTFEVFLPLAPAAAM